MSRSEMEALMEEVDWSKTPLGPRENWPQSLRTALSIILCSRFPMIIYWGNDLCVLYNDAYVPIFGKKHPDMLGRTCREAWAEIWDVLEPMFRRVLEHGEATWSSDQHLALARHGYLEECYFTWSFSPITDESGGIGGIFTAVTETTERVVAERRLKTLRELGENVAAWKTVDAACVRSARVLEKNAADVPFALVYLLDDAGEVARLVASAGMDPGGLASPYEVDITRASLWQAADVIRTCEMREVRNTNAALGWLPGGPWPEPAESAMVMPIAGALPDRPCGFIVAGASPRRPIDERYRDFFALLANHVSNAVSSARAHEEEKSRSDALARIDRAKTAFFSNVSHEFRTPLTLMLAPQEDALARGSLAGEDLQAVHRNTLRLLRLVNALLDFSRIEAGRAQASYEPVDLAALTRDLASAFRAAIERAGLRFDVDCSPLRLPIWIDRDMWEKIVLNLLSNALKFTFEGSITACMREHEDGVVLAVKDTGCGIPQKEIPRVFERFHRIEGTRARTHEGSGIGLALVHELVRFHGGHIRVESKVGVGTTFTVFLPHGNAHLPPDRLRARCERNVTSGAEAFVQEALRWSPGGETHVSHDPSSPRILVADDNADMREYLTRILGRQWNVDAVSDGRIALERALANPPDLILSDVMMPRLDGFGLLHALKADPRTKDVPFIMLSARAGEESRVDGLQAGADDYLVKPFGTRELVARIHTHLQLASARKNAERERSELEEAHAIAERASRVKDEFLAMLGHEMRNPLAPIVTSLHLLRMRGVHSREQAVIERQVDHLVRLVDDLLDISRITRGKIELKKERFELGRAVISGIEIASPLLEQRKHHLEVDVPPDGLAIDGDPGRVAQIVSNLLTNAAKYSEIGSTIWLRAERDADRARLVVRDEGVGIEESMLTRIFDMFVQQSQSLDRSKGGLGLGLAIVKSLVEMHGGIVTASSEGIGRGSTFTVDLPLALAVETSRDVGSQLSLPSASRCERVLVVDDNIDAAEAFAEILQQLGFQVVIAHDGPSGLALAKSFNPDVCLVDIGLPVMDGYELARNLRSDMPRARLIALTGYGQSSDRTRSAEAGFSAHLVKPVSMDLLEQTVNEGLRKNEGTSGKPADVC